MTEERGRKRDKRERDAGDAAAAADAADADDDKGLATHDDSQLWFSVYVFHDTCRTLVRLLRDVV